MPTFLNGLALRFYKGIGPEIQKLAPFRDFNFFIGANNAGKSTVLDFIHKHLSSRGGKKRTLEPLERYTGAKSGEPQFSLALPFDNFVESALKNLRGSWIAGSRRA